MSIAGGLLATFCLASPALADQVICEPGSGAGQCQDPRGVAVDRAAGLLFVADNGNKRVDVFDADTGVFVRAFGWDVAPEGAPGDTVSDGLEVCTVTCQAGVAGAGRGQFSFLTSIAVDNDPASPAFGDVYVYDGGEFDSGNKRVQRFHANGEFVVTFGGKVNKTKVDASAPAADQNRCPVDPGDVCQAGTLGTAPGFFFVSFVSGSPPRIAVGPGGLVHVLDNIGGGDRRVQRFNPDGELVSACSPLAPGDFGEAVRGLAVDSSGAFYAANGGGTGAVRKYDPSCALVASFHASFSIQALVLDAADNLFVADSTVGGGTAVYQYTSSGAMTRVHYGNGTLQSRAIGLAIYSSPGGDIFAAEGSGGPSPPRVVHYAFQAPGPAIPPAPELTFASQVGNTKATLHTEVNSEGKATTYHFEYVTHETYTAEGFSNPLSRVDTAETAVTPASIPPFVTNPLFGLVPVSHPVGCAAPTDPPQLECLTPSTLYHFRAVATNADGEDTGPEATFETKPPFEITDLWSSEVGADSARLSATADPLGIPLTGRFQYLSEAQLLANVDEGKDPFEGAQQSAEVDFGSGEGPATRGVVIGGLSPGTSYRYRLVVENAFGLQGESETLALATFEPRPGGADACLNAALRIGAAAELPDCRAHEMVSPVDKGGGEIQAAGGAHKTIGNEIWHETVQAAATVPAEGKGLTYSSTRSFGDSASAPYAAQYLASRQPLGSPLEGWSSHGISPRREGPMFQTLIGLGTQYKAFSQDLGHGWLRTDSEPTLADDALPGYPNVYRRDNDAEAYRPFCAAAPPSRPASTYVPEPQGFTPDGSAMVMRANAQLTLDAAPTESPYQTYACGPDGEIALVSVLPGGAANPDNSSVGTHIGILSGVGDHRNDSVHNALSADAQRVYWTDLDSNNVRGGKIYLRENPLADGGECAGPDAPCTRAVSEAVGVAGASQKAHFWTASADGSRAIFSFTEGPLTGNLYEFDATVTSGNPTQLIAGGVSGLAGWSEDATRLYLASTEGAEAGEVNLYLYEAGSFELVAADVGGECSHNDGPFGRCARATPDASQLAFMSRERLTGYDNRDLASGKADAEVFLYDAAAAELTCVSCNPSGGRPAGRDLGGVNGGVAAQIRGWEHSFHAARNLSTDGRRLFFESFDSLVLEDTNGAADVYQWEAAGKGGCEASDHDYFPQNGGCLALISSGKSPRDSRFVDASADGSDVFFKTAESLWPADPGLLDIYDARVGGGFIAPDPPQPPCEGDACQSPAAAPDAPTPGSSTVAGRGNLPPARARRCPKGKRRVMRGGKARCVKKRSRRAGAERKGGRR